MVGRPARRRDDPARLGDDSGSASGRGGRSAPATAASTSRPGSAGGDDPFRRQIRSARLWGLGWPLALIVAAGLAALLVGGPVAGGSAAGLLALALPAQVVRIAARNRSRAGGLRAALAYGVLTMVGKWFQTGRSGRSTSATGSRGRHARLIEYKFAGP